MKAVATIRVPCVLEQQQHGRRNPTVATDIYFVALEELLDKTGADVDFAPIKAVVRWATELMEDQEVTRQIACPRHERTPERKTHRNGYRLTGRRTPGWRHHRHSTSPGTPGGYFPSWLGYRRRAGEGVLAVVREAYIRGVNTRKVRRTGQATLGMTGINKSEKCQGSVPSWTGWSETFPQPFPDRPIPLPVAHGCRASRSGGRPGAKHGVGGGRWHRGHQ